MLKRFLNILLVYIPLGFVVLSLTLVMLYKWVPVKWTPLMLKRTIENVGNKDYRNKQVWTDIEEISPKMIQAVLASEDGRFLEHHGFDFKELKKMKRDHDYYGKKIRGCSTISQQVAKNCFTWCSRTWVRKAFEAYYTILIEVFWDKERIMEVYLNVAETGRGLFGVEAASWEYFGISSSQLTLSDAVGVACCLPKPLARTPDVVSLTMPKHKATIAKRASMTPFNLKHNK